MFFNVSDLNYFLQRLRELCCIPDESFLMSGVLTLSTSGLNKDAALYLKDFFFGL